MKRKKNVQINSVFDRYFKNRYVFKKTIILATKFLPTCKHVFQTYLNQEVTLVLVMFFFCFLIISI